MLEKLGHVVIPIEHSSLLQKVSKRVHDAALREGVGNLLDKSEPTTDIRETGWRAKVSDRSEDLLRRAEPFFRDLEPCEFDILASESKFLPIKYYATIGAMLYVSEDVPEGLLDIVVPQTTVINASNIPFLVSCDVVWCKRRRYHGHPEGCGSIGNATIR